MPTAVSEITISRVVYRRSTGAFETNICLKEVVKEFSKALMMRENIEGPAILVQHMEVIWRVPGLRVIGTPLIRTTISGQWCYLSHLPHINAKHCEFPNGTWRDEGPSAVGVTRLKIAVCRIR